jgi:hypothetical protein
MSNEKKRCGVILTPALGDMRLYKKAVSANAGVIYSRPPQ